MHEIISRKEARERGLLRYFTGNPCRNGHLDQRFVSSNGCLTCERDRNARRREDPEFRERAAQRSAEWRSKPGNGDKNAAVAKKWRQANPERFRAGTDRWVRNNPEKVRAINQRCGRNYRQQKPEVPRLHARARGRRVKLATPRWVDRAALREIYRLCPDDMVVDHVVPINGDTVCGLHVPWNLQYLTPSENSAKGNRWPWQPEERLAA